jgi:phosphoglycerol transferase
VVSTSREYGSVAAASALVAALVLRPWSGGWSTPLVYRNDTLSALAMVDAAGWTGTARGAPGLGAPWGTSWVDFPLGPDRLHLVLWRVLRLFADDRFVVLNLFVLVGFVLVALAAHGVIRHLGVSPWVAGALAVVFSLAPYHFERLVLGHLFLAAYYAVPLGVLLAIWAVDGSLVRQDGRWLERVGRPGRVGWALCWIVVIGSASAYYAAYTVVLVLGLGAATALRRRRASVLVAPGAVSVGLLGVVVANVAGDLWRARSLGTNLEASGRDPSDLARFALDPLALVAPEGSHRVAPLARLGEQLREAPFQGGAYLGLLALAGLVLVAVRCVRPSDTTGSSATTDRRLAVLAGVAVVTSWLGAAWLLGSLGITQIRVWDRMSIVVTFLGLAGLGRALDRWSVPARSLAAPAVVAVALVAVAVVDQPGALEPGAAVARTRAVDAEVASSLQELLDPGDSVFQFPYVAFPADVTDRGMPSYAHLGPWASGDGSLVFSAGAMQGRGGDWQATWSAQEPEAMAVGLAAAGVDAIYVDRRGDATPYAQRMPRSGAATADALRAAGLTGMRSADGTREWFDLRPLQRSLRERWGSGRTEQLGRAVQRPIGVTFEGASAVATTPSGSRDLASEASITLRREDDDRAPVRVSFDLTGAPGTTVRVSAPDEGGVRRASAVRLGRGATPVSLEVGMDAAASRVELQIEPSGAGGEAQVRLTNLEVLDRTLVEAGEQLRLSDS